MQGERKELESGRHSPSAVELSSRMRWSCFFGGVLVTGYAGTVLWRGVDGVATVAFVALAALLLIFAVAGVVPRRIKSGDSEIELTRDQVEQAAQETTDAAIDTMTRAELEQYIADTLRTAGNGDPTGIKFTAASRAQEAADFERQVGQLLRRIFLQVEEAPVAGDRGYDFLVQSEEMRIAVDVKLTIIRAGVSRLIDGARRVDADMVLYIARELSPELPHTLSRLMANSGEALPQVIFASYDAIAIGEVVERLRHPGSEASAIPGVHATFPL